MVDSHWYPLNFYLIYHVNNIIFQLDKCLIITIFQLDKCLIITIFQLDKCLIITIFQFDKGIIITIFQLDKCLIITIFQLDKGIIITIFSIVSEKKGQLMDESQLETINFHREDYEYLMQFLIRQSSMRLKSTSSIFLFLRIFLKFLSHICGWIPFKFSLISI